MEDPFPKENVAEVFSFLELAPDPKANKDEGCDGGEAKLNEAAESPVVPLVPGFFKKSKAPPDGLSDAVSVPEGAAVVPKPANPAKVPGPPSYKKRQTCKTHFIKLSTINVPCLFLLKANLKTT